MRNVRELVNDVEIILHVRLVAHLSSKGLRVARVLFGLLGGPRPHAQGRKASADCHKVASESSMPDGFIG